MEKHEIQDVLNTVANAQRKLKNLNNIMDMLMRDVTLGNNPDIGKWTDSELNNSLDYIQEQFDYAVFELKYLVEDLETTNYKIERKRYWDKQI